jgi:hypothetical protein
MRIRSINKHLFNSLTHFTHWLCKSEARHRLSVPVMRALGALTLRVKAGRKKALIEEAAGEWQRMFPSKKMVPITRIEDATVFAEIRSPCPFRGSNNLDGCYRMMEYDRKLMEAIGADFVVLQSQAEENTEYCRVAITRESKTRKDLLPAHIRVGNMRGPDSANHDL